MSEARKPTLITIQEEGKEPLKVECTEFYMLTQDQPTERFGVLCNFATHHTFLFLVRGFILACKELGLIKDQQFYRGMPPPDAPKVEVVQPNQMGRELDKQYNIKNMKRP
jgi:hypothetical protein